MGVVYGRVVSVKTYGYSERELQLDVLATLAGRDRSERDLHVMPTLVLKWSYPMGFVTAGARVVAVLQWAATNAGGTVKFDRVIVSGDSVKFMPESRPLVMVDGFEDPKVAQIVASLREVRPVVWVRYPLLRAPIAGNEPGLWDDHSLVYGNVTSIYEPGLDRARQRPAKVQFDVKATLVGKFDPALEPNITCAIDYSPANSAIKSLPQPNSRIVAVLHRADGGRFHITNETFLFMPNKSALAVVSGLDDPKVEEVTSHLRALRGMKR
jgi:hypothetical protein